MIGPDFEGGRNRAFNIVKQKKRNNQSPASLLSWLLGLCLSDVLDPVIPKTHTYNFYIISNLDGIQSLISFIFHIQLFSTK